MHIIIQTHTSHSQLAQAHHIFTFSILKSQSQITKPINQTYNLQTFSQNPATTSVNLLQLVNVSRLLQGPSCPAHGVTAQAQCQAPTNHLCKRHLYYPLQHHRQPTTTKLIARQPCSRGEKGDRAATTINLVIYKY